MREIVAKGAVTISGWVRRVGGPTSSISLNLITPTATDNYSSYNTIGACFNVNNTITGNGTATGSALTLTDNSTWYYFTVTDTSIASRTDIAKGMQLYFGLGGLDANTKYYEFSRLQVEAGSAATPFEFRPIGIELTLCQRFFESTAYPDITFNTDSTRAGICFVGATGNSSGFNFLVPKRTNSPTVTLYSRNNTSGAVSLVTTGANITGSTSSAVGGTGFRATALGAGQTGGAGIETGWTASAEL